jgi:hypothetical protein
MRYVHIWRSSPWVISFARENPSVYAFKLCGCTCVRVCVYVCLRHLHVLPLGVVTMGLRGTKVTLDLVSTWNW